MAQLRELKMRTGTVYVELLKRNSQQIVLSVCFEGHVAASSATLLPYVQYVELCDDKPHISCNTECRSTASNDDKSLILQR